MAVGQTDRKVEPPKECMESAGHFFVPCRDLKVTRCLGTIDTAAAEECAAQVGSTAALFAQQCKITRAAQTPPRKAQLREQRRHCRTSGNINDVGAPPQLRHALHRDGGLNRTIHRAQQTNDAARHSSTRRRKTQPLPARTVRLHGGAHAQKCREFRRLAAGTVNIRARESIFHIRSKGRHLSSPENHRPYA